MTADYLSALGFRVAEAGTGAAALDAASTLQPHVILLDLVLPDMDGWQVLARLRESDRTRALKVAIHTANVTETAREQAQKWGVDLFLPRPCDMEVLGHQLAATIGATESAPETTHG
jgi:CheY-like chemotaxis protein